MVGGLWKPPWPSAPKVMSQSSHDARRRVVPRSLYELQASEALGAHRPTLMFGGC